MQRLLLFREGSHDKTDQAGQPREYLREVPSRRTTKGQTISAHVGDFQVEQLLADRRLPGRTFSEAEVNPARQKRQQIQDAVAQGHLGPVWINPGTGRGHAEAKAERAENQ